MGSLPLGVVWSYGGDGNCMGTGGGSPATVDGFRGLFGEDQGQELTLVHFSAQPQPFLVTEATASVHFSTQPETFLPMRPLNIAHKK